MEFIIQFLELFLDIVKDLAVQLGPKNKGIKKKVIAIFGSFSFFIVWLFLICTFLFLIVVSVRMAFSIDI